MGSPTLPAGRRDRSRLLARHSTALLLGSVPASVALVAPAAWAAAATLRSMRQPWARVSGAGAVGDCESVLLFDTDSAHLSTASLRDNDFARTGRDAIPLGPEEVSGGVAFGFDSCPARDCVTHARPQRPGRTR